MVRGDALMVEELLIFAAVMLTGIGLGLVFWVFVLEKRLFKPTPSNGGKK